MSACFANLDKEMNEIRVLTNHQDDANDFSDSQSYGFFGFLGCHYRNYSQVPVINGIVRVDPPTKILVGERIIPEDWMQEAGYFYVPVKTLMEFNWDSTFEDRRGAGRSVLPEGQGKMTTYKEEFGYFYTRLPLLARSGADILLYSFFD